MWASMVLQVVAEYLVHMLYERPPIFVPIQIPLRADGAERVEIKSDIGFTWYRSSRYA